MASNGAEGNNKSATIGRAISADGSLVVFESDASNLDLVSADTNDSTDVFVHDRKTGITTRVSLPTGSAENGNKPSYKPSISPDGRYVAFGSDADNLVPNDNNNTGDIFVHDRQTKETIRISVATNKDNNSSYPLSENGHYVVLQSFASDLTPNEDNSGNPDIYVYDRLAEITTAISMAATGEEPPPRLLILHQTRHA